MKCENCNKDHNGMYGSGRFCSSKCARGFSTKAKRKEINEKVSRTLIKRASTKDKNTKKKNKCQSCNIEIEDTTKYCKDCHRYYKNIELFKKLRLYDTSKSLKYMGTDTLKILVDLYFNKRMSMPDIRKKYNIWYSTIKSFINKHGINLRNFSESSSNAVYTGKIKLDNNATMQYHHGWHTTWDNKKVYYRSNYELDYAKELDNKEIPYEMEFKRILYFDTQMNKYRIAIPDFYLPMENTIIEIKSTWTYNKQNMKDKFKAYRENGYSCKLILNHKQVNI